MSDRMPLLDARTAADVAAQIEALLVQGDAYQGQPLPADPQRDALVAIAARFAELVIHRLNQVPAKNFIAFLDLLGASQLPPQPARAPLTFSLAVGSTQPAIVPAGTQVAAAPGEGQKEPAIFETERELVAMPVRLSAVFSRDPDRDRYAEWGALAGDAGTQGLAVFAPAQRVEHELHLGLGRILACSEIEALSLAFELPAQDDLRAVAWDFHDGTAWQPVATSSDTTKGLQLPGTVVLGLRKAVPLAALAGRTERWLRCRLDTAITPATGPVPGRVRASRLPAISRIVATVQGQWLALAPDAAFCNATPLDLARPFQPFGETPKAGDIFYLRCDEAFSLAGAEVTVRVALGQPFGPAEAAPTLKWEVGNGPDWVDAGAEAPWDTAPGAGTITFRVGARPRASTVNGMAGYWVRGRIAALKPAPASIKPPIASGILVDCKGVLSAPPQLLVTRNERTIAPADLRAGPVVPFTITADRQPTLYLGFEAAGTGGLPNRPISLYVGTADAGSAPTLSSEPAAIEAVPTRLAWEYWNAGWAPLPVDDDTQGFARAGIVQFLAPPDIQPGGDFAVGPRYWIRARREQGGEAGRTLLTRLLPNTVMAAQATTVRSEVLGSSDGSANQRLATTRAPVLPGQRLEVREPELPAAAERASLAAEEGADILAAGDADGGRAVWVRWHDVPDFHASGPRSRHYVVDRLAGAILFGDGRNGLVPPVGTGNLRLAHYRTGGGSAGNRPAGTIAQLKTTVPYVDKVNNVAPAMGGSDAETLQQAAERVPRQVRHGDRAVTVEDYEDLAHEASPEVGRAWCIAPAGAGPDAGLVQVVVVPRSTDARPMPSAELVRRVQDHLAARCCATARVRVVAPDYLQLTVTAKVGVNSPGAAVAVVAAVQERIEAFLHPLTGGAGGTGWAIGARPRDLDFHLLLAHVPGLDHIDSLRIEQAAGEGVARSGRFLVCAGPPLVKADL